MDIVCIAGRERKRMPSALSIVRVAALDKVPSPWSFLPGHTTTP